MYRVTMGQAVPDSNGWYLATLSHYEADIDVIRSVEGIGAFIYLKVEIWSSDTDFSLRDVER